MMNNKVLKMFCVAALITGCLWNSANAQLPAGTKIPVIPFDKIEIITTRVAPHFYVLTGSKGVDPGHPEAAGGRIGVFAGPDGVFIVDASYAPLFKKITAAIRNVSDAPIRFLVNTHEHPDHTGGNPQFAKLGALIFAREETRQDMSKRFPPALAAVIGSAASDTDKARLPIVTYGSTGPLKIYLNGEVIDIIPVVASHTNGDSMIRFENEDVIMIGDFYRNYGYPFIDPTHGGNFSGVIIAIDNLLQISGPDTKLVPGHGTIINKSDLLSYRAMIVDIRTKVQKMIADGKTKTEVLAGKLTEPYDASVPGGTVPLPAGLGTSADRFVGNLYDELKN